MGIAARLRARWYLALIAVVVGVLVGVATLYHVGSHGLTEKRSVYHVGTAQLLVDTDPSALTSITGVQVGLAARAPYIAQYATSPSVTAAISQAFGHPVQIQAAVSSAAQLGVANNTPSTKVITGSGSASVVLKATSSDPAITISTQAGTLHAARALAVATVNSLRGALTSLQKKQAAALAAKHRQALKNRTNGSSTTPATPGTTTSTPLKIALRTIGAITATNTVSTPKKSHAILYGLGAFIVMLLLILVLDNLLRGVGAGRRAKAPVTSSTD